MMRGAVLQRVITSKCISKLASGKAAAGMIAHYCSGVHILRGEVNLPAVPPRVVLYDSASNSSEAISNITYEQMRSSAVQRNHTFVSHLLVDDAQ